MIVQNASIEMLETVASALGPMLDEIAFVGGATATIYVNPNYATPLRPTDDVDCVVEIVGRVGFHKLEDRLRNLGFKNDITSKVICRWKIGEITVDVMPTDTAILGFSNNWYKLGFENKEETTLPTGRKIFVFPLPIFLATKFEALLSRGGKDWRMAHDLEDILLVISGCDDVLAKIQVSQSEVRSYLSEKCKNFLGRTDSSDLLDVHIGQIGGDSTKSVAALITQISKL